MRQDCLGSVFVSTAGLNVGSVTARSISDQEGIHFFYPGGTPVKIRDKFTLQI